jgi:hypothetical protein
LGASDAGFPRAETADRRRREFVTAELRWSLGKTVATIVGITTRERIDTGKTKSELRRAWLIVSVILRCSTC